MLFRHSFYRRERGGRREDLYRMNGIKWMNRMFLIKMAWRRDLWLERGTKSCSHFVGHAK
jgi:hypothetical protein